MLDRTAARGLTKASAARHALLVLAGVAVLTLSSKVSVPFYPVPMTFQTAAVLLVGFAYGSRLGAFTVLAWLGVALAGAPVLASAAAGPAVFAGPTAGYLAGFVAAAALAGWAVERGWRGLKLLGVSLAGAAAIFAMGWAYLAVLIGAEPAFAAGVVPFLLGDAVKVALAWALASAGVAGLALPRKADEV